jgi:hypothetical protein
MSRSIMKRDRDLVKAVEGTLLTPPRSQPDGEAWSAACVERRVRVGTPILSGRRAGHAVLLLAQDFVKP